jgi:hypothetical protein
MSTLFEIKEKFVNNAITIVDLYLNRALDKRVEHRSLAEKAQDKIWDAMVPMIQQLGEARKLEAGSTAGVIDLLRSGNVTVDEALKLMTMLRTQVEADILPDLQNKLEELEGKQ